MDREQKKREGMRGKSCCCYEWRQIVFTNYKLLTALELGLQTPLSPPLFPILPVSYPFVSSFTLMLFAALPAFSSPFFSPALILLLPSSQLREGNKDLHAAAVKVLTSRKVSDGTVSLCVCVIYLTSPDSCNTAETGEE